MPRSLTSTYADTLRPVNLNPLYTLTYVSIRSARYKTFNFVTFYCIWCGRRFEAFVVQQQKESNSLSRQLLQLISLTDQCAQLIQAVQQPVRSVISTSWFQNRAIYTWHHTSAISLVFNGGVYFHVTQTFFIYQFTTFFGLDRPSSGDSRGRNTNSDGLHIN
jgi:hypothetical protein